jgi:hypothetical protein
MPMPRAAEPRIQPLLLRLTVRQAEVLESVAHLERMRSNTYAYRVLVEHLTAMAKNPRVRADLKNRAAYDADAARTTPLRARTQQRSRVAAAQVDDDKPPRRARG